MKRRSLIALAATGALLLAACGSDDAAPADTTAPATDPVATDPAPATDPATTEPATTDPAPSGTADGRVDRSDWPDKLVFTLTPSQETGGLIETAKPLAEMLAAELDIEVEALVPTDYAGVIVALESGQAQVAGGLGPRQMVQAEEQAGAKLILQAERFGSLLYVTQWFTNDPTKYCSDTPVPDEDGALFCNGVLDADGPEAGPIGAEQLAKLDGVTVAFVDQGSTSGYAIPALQLIGAGVDPETGVDPLFAGGHDRSVQAVYDGDAAVGVSFNDARGQIEETSADVGQKVVVFGWSGPIPNDGFAVAGDLPQSLVDAITEAFVSIANTDEGAAVLDELYEIDGLVPVTSSDYDVIRDLEKALGDALE